MLALSQSLQWQQGPHAAELLGPCGELSLDVDMADPVLARGLGSALGGNRLRKHETPTACHWSLSLSHTHTAYNPILIFLRSICYLCLGALSLSFFQSVVEIEHTFKNCIYL